MAKTVIEITEDNLCKLMIEDDRGVKEIRHLTFDTLVKTLNISMEVDADEEYINALKGNFSLSEILPGDNMISTIQTKTMTDQDACWYVMLREGVPANFNYKDKIYKNVAMPKLLFAVKVFKDKCANIKIAAVKTNKITNKTEIYRYPYSNVFDTRNVCLGGNLLSDFKLNGLQNIVMIPEMFLSMPNNNDGYAGSNTSNLPYSELLEVLEEAEFDNDILRESSVTKTYEDFITTLN